MQEPACCAPRHASALATAHAVRRAPSRASRPAPRRPSALAALAILVGVAGSLLPGGLAAQEAGTSGAEREADPVNRALEAVAFRSPGPAGMGGRVADVAAVPGDPSTFYVGFATGGVWKTTDHGASFAPVFDDRVTSSIGDVTVAASNPKVVYVGTGEPQNRQSSPWGAGVWRSVDGGKSWTSLGLQETRHVGRIVVHPGDANVAYVAAVGHLWGPNPERGVYRTTDGGDTWEKVLFVDEDTGAIDLAMDPEHPEILYAATYQRRRTNFGFNGGGPGSGVWRTLDGGDTWTELTEGLPGDPKGRIGLAVYRDDPDVVYAIIEHGEEGGVYRSTDRGDTWEKRSDTNPRPMYYSQIRVDPRDLERVYLGGTSFYVSDDGGKSFESHRFPGVHVDHHAIWIDPSDTDHLLLGNDGGLYVSWDRARTWRMYDNLAVGQFYELGVSQGGEALPGPAYTVCGGLQDNGTWCGPSATYDGEGIRNALWREVNGGDGFYAEIDPRDPSVLYAEFQNGNLRRIDLDTEEGQWITPVLRPEDEEALFGPKAAEPGAPGEEEAAEAEEAEEEAEEERELRWNWNSPVELSPHDPDVVYYGSNALYRSPDRGMSWERISPDLTKAVDRDTLEIMGRELGEEGILSRNDGIGSFGNITTVSVSPLDADVVYAGTDDGNLQVTRDGGETWSDVADAVPGLPEISTGTYVSRVVASRASPGRAYATFDGHYNDDYAAYVYRSDDYGASWRRITDGLPASSVNVLAEHPRTHDLLFVGNERGVWVSLDAGESWRELEAGLPTVPVDDMEIQVEQNALVLGTHGRSIWILDDLALPEALAAGAGDGAPLLERPVHLFPVPPAELANTSGHPYPAGAFLGENPPRGAVLRYWLRDDAEADSVELTLLAADGDTVRTLKGPGTAGGHSLTWDLRREPPYRVERQQGFFGGPRGPRVLPGSYTVRLEANGAAAETAVEVRSDPRIDVAREVREARHAALMEIYRLAGPVHEAELRLDTLEARIEAMEKLLGAPENGESGELEEGADGDSDAAPGRTAADSAALARVRELEAAVDSVENDLDEATGELFFTFFGIDGVTARPTEDQLWRIDRAWEETPPVLERLNRLLVDRAPEVLRRVYTEEALPSLGDPVAVPSREGGG